MAGPSGQVTQGQTNNAEVTLFEDDGRKVATTVLQQTSEFIYLDFR